MRRNVRRLAREVSGGAKSTDISRGSIVSNDTTFAASPRNGTQLIAHVVPETSVGGVVTSSGLLGAKDDSQNSTEGRN